MVNVELDVFAKTERTVNTGQGNHLGQPDTDHETPLGVINSTDEEHFASDDVADEYHSVIRSTVIVTGVSLALFCVSHRFSIEEGSVLTTLI